MESALASGEQGTPTFFTNAVSDATAYAPLVTLLAASKASSAILWPGFPVDLYKRVYGKEIMVETITREELREKMDRGDEFMLVDTLGTEVYEESHLPGAINLPLEDVDRAGEVLPDKSAEIVVYCMNAM